MSQTYNFFNTKKYDGNMPLYYFFDACLGIFIFRVIETFTFKGPRSPSKYYTRAIFRHLLAIRMALKIFGYNLEFLDSDNQRFFQSWMTFLYNVILLVAIVMLEKSFQDFISYIGQHTKYSPTFINVVGLIYFIINTIFLMSYAILLGKGKQNEAEHLYTCFLFCVFVAVFLFIHFPFCSVLWEIYKNDFGSNFATRIMYIVVFFAIASVFAVGATIVRIVYSISLMESLQFSEETSSFLKKCSMWTAAIYELAISASETFIDYTLDHVVPTVSSSTDISTDELTRNLCA